MPDQVDSALQGIKEKYDSEFYPFEVKESGGGWQFLTKKDYHKTIAQLNGDKFLKRLSNAALETLAIIAYKQPITKGEIEAIRGVNSDYSIQKLLEKELILISGRNENAPGKPLVYATSKNFMDYFGINSASDLPKIREVLAEQMVEGTRPEDFTDLPVAENIGTPSLAGTLPGEEGDISEVVAVNEDGELVLAPEETSTEEIAESNTSTETESEETPATEESSEDISDETPDKQDPTDEGAASDEEQKDQPE
ncbi:MAG: SMC-Scp complex subunit ScpB [Bacteroidota bacterium]